MLLYSFLKNEALIAIKNVAIKNTLKFINIMQFEIIFILPTNINIINGVEKDKNPVIILLIKFFLYINQNVVINNIIDTIFKKYVINSNKF